MISLPAFLKKMKDNISIWGIHPVMEFLGVCPDRCVSIYTLPSFGKKKKQSDLLERASHCSIPVKIKNSFDSIVLKGAVHQGVAAVVEPVWEHPAVEIDGILSEGMPLIFICDQLSDPHNLGAIIRNCAAFGASCLILPEKNTPPVNGTVAKASAGALFYVKIFHVKNLARTMRYLKEKGIWIVGLAGEGRDRIEEIDMTSPIAIVAGSEVSGLRSLVQRECDMMGRISMAETIDSLNVASASAVTLYEARRQRRLAGC